MSTLALLAVTGLVLWWLMSLALAAVISLASPTTTLADVVLVDEQPRALVPVALIDVDIELLQISVIPPAERTAAEWEALDRLLDERAALTLPRVRPSVPVTPGWSR